MSHSCKHLRSEYLTLDAIEEADVVLRCTAVRGGGLYDAELPDGTGVIVQASNAFRNKIFVRRSQLLLCRSTDITTSEGLPVYSLRLPIPPAAVKGLSNDPRFPSEFARKDDSVVADFTSENPNRANLAAVEADEDDSCLGSEIESEYESEYE